jgi:hypothetical protein
LAIETGQLQSGASGEQVLSIYIIFIVASFSSGTFKGFFNRFDMTPETGGLLRIGIILGNDATTKSSLNTTVQEVELTYDTKENSDEDKSRVIIGIIMWGDNIIFDEKICKKGLSYVFSCAKVTFADECFVEKHLERTMMVKLLSSYTPKAEVLSLGPRCLCVTCALTISTYY